MIASSNLWTLRLLTMSLALCLLSGCGKSEPTGTVSGKVTLDGQPVTAGQIGFISAAGFSAIADIGADGSFTLLENMPVDTYTVTVNGPALTEAPGEEGGDAVAPQTNIPDGYMDESTSDIKQTVVVGANSVTVELKAAGPTVGAGPADMAP